MDVKCSECKAKDVIADPGDDGWYGVDVDGVHVQRVTWVCINGHQNHIDREVAQ